ncbi:MAG TPA: hypothetical protein VK173_05720 [Lacibacter sp.]|nr:hypothetical protein [Lacibacter sp.]
MKKIIVTIAAFLFFAVTYATDKVEKNIERSFQSEFPGATHASWSRIESSGLYAVRFVYNGEGLMAYFDIDGNYLAVARNILEHNLPLSVKKTFSTINTSGALATSQELTVLGETSYLFQFKEGDQLKTYQVYTDGSIKRIKIKKLLTN